MSLKSVTGALWVAVRRLNRVRLRDDTETAARAARIRTIAADAGPRWAEPYRSAVHGDLLYDDAGLPR